MHGTNMKIGDVLYSELIWKYLLAVDNSSATFSLWTLRHLLVSEYGKGNRN